MSSLTHEALGPDQLQSYFISQDGGVAMGDVGEGARMDKHRGSLRVCVTQNPKLKPLATHTV